MRIRNRYIIRSFAVVFVFLARTLFKTLRIEKFSAQQRLLPLANNGHERFVYSFWHDTLLVPIFAIRVKHMVALISQHRDGSVLADAMKLVGVSAVRGSSRRGGAQAVRELMQIAEGNHFVLTPDGPRGPRREVKQGVVYLASRTGKAIVPGAFVCPNAWHIQGDWTDFVIPKPFSTVYCALGEPIRIPPDVPRQDIGSHIERVQQAMDRLDAQTWQWANGESLSDTQPIDTKAAA